MKKLMVQLFIIGVVIARCRALRISYYILFLTKLKAQAIRSVLFYCDKFDSGYHYLKRFIIIISLNAVSRLSSPDKSLDFQAK